MKRVIAGKTYNTDTARLIGSNDHGFNPTEPYYACDSLYCEKTGEYFLCSVLYFEQRIKEFEIIPYVLVTARTWCECNLKPAVYAEEFLPHSAGNTVPFTDYSAGLDSIDLIWGDTAATIQ
jgi:hypothetical protein